MHQGSPRWTISTQEIGDMEPHPSETTQLSPRMQEVLNLYARGYTHKEIATALNIHRNTLHRYAYIAMSRLGARTVIEAVVIFEKTINPKGE